MPPVTPPRLPPSSPAQLPFGLVIVIASVGGAIVAALVLAAVFFVVRKASTSRVLSPRRFFDERSGTREAKVVEVALGTLSDCFD